MESRAALAMTMISVLSCGQTRLEGDVGGDAQADSECPTGLGPFELVECGGDCLYLDRNAANCGACGKACATDEACILGVCVDLCDEVDVSTSSALAGLLMDLSWVSTRGLMTPVVIRTDEAGSSIDPPERMIGVVASVDEYDVLKVPVLELPSDASSSPSRSARIVARATRRL